MTSGAYLKDVRSVPLSMIGMDHQQQLHMWEGIWVAIWVGGEWLWVVGVDGWVISGYIRKDNTDAMLEFNKQLHHYNYEVSNTDSVMVVHSNAGDHIWGSSWGQGHVDAVTTGTLPPNTKVTEINVTIPI